MAHTSTVIKQKVDAAGPSLGDVALHAAAARRRRLPSRQMLS
jgi:hypothetical protein